MTHYSFFHYTVEVVKPEGGLLRNSVGKLWGVKEEK